MRGGGSRTAAKAQESVGFEYSAGLARKNQAQPASADSIMRTVRPG